MSWKKIQKCILFNSPARIYKLISQLLTNLLKIKILKFLIWLAYKILLCLLSCLELTHYFFIYMHIVLQWRETLTIGTTKLLPSEVEDLSRRMGKNYQGRFYHLIDKYELFSLFSI